MLWKEAGHEEQKDRARAPFSASSLPKGLQWPGLDQAKLNSQELHLS